MDFNFIYLIFVQCVSCLSGDRTNALQVSETKNRISLEKHLRIDWPRHHTKTINSTEKRFPGIILTFLSWFRTGGTKCIEYFIRLPFVSDTKNSGNNAGRLFASVSRIRLEHFQKKKEKKKENFRFFADIIAWLPQSIRDYIFRRRQSYRLTFPDSPRWHRLNDIKRNKRYRKNIRENIKDQLECTQVWWKTPKFHIFVARKIVQKLCLALSGWTILSTLLSLFLTKKWNFNSSLELFFVTFL